MISLTRKTDYALVALAALAETVTEVAPVSARSVAEMYTLPLPQMMNIFKDLQRAGLVRSSRGSRGGYRLAVEPKEIGLLRVIEAIEGPVRLAACCDDDDEGDEPCVSCSVIDRCPITVGTRRLNELMISFLERVTLRDLMESKIDVPLDMLGPSRDRSGTASGEYSSKERT